MVQRHNSHCMDAHCENELDLIYACAWDNS
jgi:hypothetical protein